MLSPTARNIGALVHLQHCLLSYKKYRVDPIMSYIESCGPLIYTLVISRIDYANCLLYGIADCLINKLQIQQNASARLVVCCHRRDHITPVLKKLHWLPVKQCIHYAFLLLAFLAKRGLAPAYITNLLHVQRTTRVLSSATKNICMCRHLVADTVT